MARASRKPADQPEDKAKAPQAEETTEVKQPWTHRLGQTISNMTAKGSQGVGRGVAHIERVPIVGSLPVRAVAHIGGNVAEGYKTERTKIAARLAQKEVLRNAEAAVELANKALSGAEKAVLEQAAAQTAKVSTG